MRDLGALESAIATPQHTFGREYLHPTKAAMAPRSCSTSHRTIRLLMETSGRASNAAITFLHLNDVEPTFDEDALVTLVLGVAQGQISKEEISKFFGANIRPLR